MSSRWRRCAQRSVPRRGFGSTQTGSGRRNRPSSGSPRWSPSGSSSPSSRRRTWRSSPSCGRGRRSRSRPTRASPASTTPGERASSAPASWRRSSSRKWAGSVPRARSRRPSRCICPALSTVRSGWRPPPTSPRRFPPTATLGGSPTASRPSSCSRTPSRRSSARCARACCICRTVRGSASRSTRAQSSDIGSSGTAPGRGTVRAVDPTNRNTALASALVEELARCGIRHAALAPGSRSTPLALALWRQPAIEVAVIVDERSAGYFALGAAQASRRPAAVLCTSGTAAANLHPAVCEADEAGVPMIVLTGDRPPELRGVGAGQTIDQLKLYGAAVRWFCELGNHDADDVGLLYFRSVACRAYAAARGEPRPGPVHLNFPWRDPLGPEPHPEEVTATSKLALEGRGERPLTAVASGPPLPDGALLDEIAERLSETPRGLIVAGRQLDPGLARPVAALAEKAAYPVLAEPTSQLRLGDHDRALVVWPYDAIARLRPPELEPEFVIRFGDMPTSKALRQWLGAPPGPGPGVGDAAFR